MKLRTAQSRRGAALVTAIILMGILAMVIAALLLYVSKQRLRTIASVRAMTRESCAGGGLQYARSYFGRNSASNWTPFLAKPSVYDATHPHPYNPIASTWNTFPADPTTAAGRSYISAFNGGAGASLLTDLDGDGNPDVYIYVRDNDDEVMPLAQDWGRDNDLSVIVGSMCISSTMVPRGDNSQGGTDPLLVESLLFFSDTTIGPTSQANGGASGSGNLN